MPLARDLKIEVGRRAQEMLIWYREPLNDGGFIWMWSYNGWVCTYCQAVYKTGLRSIGEIEDAKVKGGIRLSNYLIVNKRRYPVMPHYELFSPLAGVKAANGEWVLTDETLDAESIIILLRTHENFKNPQLREGFIEQARRWRPYVAPTIAPRVPR